MGKLEDLTFTDKEAKRILAEAAEREARDSPEERTIGYNQLVEIAQGALIDPKYLKVSAKQLVQEIGGLEKATIRRMAEKSKEILKCSSGGFLNGYFSMSRLEENSKNLSESNAELFTFYHIFGVMAYFASFIGTLTVPDELRPYFGFLFGLGTATQIGSGLYKWYQSEKNKIIEEMNGDKK